MHRKPAIDPYHHPLGPQQIGIAADALGDQFGVFDVGALRFDRAGTQHLVIGQQIVGEESVGRHIAMLRAIEAVLPETIGRSMPINVNGAIPAVMLDAGFPLAALKSIFLLARIASLIAHLQEETQEPSGIIMGGAATERIDFQSDS